MATSTIYWGETVEISSSAETPAGASVAIDGTWSAACRVTRDAVAGKFVEDVTMTIADGVATGEIDTSTGTYRPGSYFLDVRFTAPDGRDHWSGQEVLVLETRNTPSST